MPRSAEAIVNPELLVWGRETIGYDLDTAAKKIGVDPERLVKWEKGDEDDHPTVKRLFKIANVYKRPFAAFYFSSPPTHWDEPYDKLEDWRTLPETENVKKSPGLVLELREAARRREILLDLAEEMDEIVPEFNFVRQSMETSTSLALRIRETLGLSVEDQKSCNSYGTALKMWRLAVENLGVLVFQTGFFGGHYPVDIRDMRGVALHFDNLPIIIINSKDSASARIFTILHELGHLILRQSGLSNFREFQTLDSNEVFCNEFAGELLVPSQSLLSETEVMGHFQKKWNDSELIVLAKRYKVSKAVILRRLLENHKTTQAHYSEMLEKWKEEWEQFQDAPRSSGGGGPPYHTKFVRCHGSRFVSTVFDAYDQDVIHAGQLSEFLSARFKHHKNIRDDLARVLT